MNIKQVDIDALLETAISRLKEDGIKVNPLSTLTNFWSRMANYDMRDVAEDCRIREAKRLVKKALDLYIKAFKWFTLIQTPPTPEEVADRNKYYMELKERYLEAHHLPCGTKLPPNIIAELKRIGPEFQQLFAALSGLDELDSAQKEGKPIYWEIYGGPGNAPYGPMQIGWDSKDLIKKRVKQAV